ncbi:hypothetical protein LEP1GSC166_1377 [Leptospira kirschneri]|nr:hypothetical protein LEP1GSC166_1377 [Leptospira kirschneri]
MKTICFLFHFERSFIKTQFDSFCFKFHLLEPSQKELNKTLCWARFQVVRLASANNRPPV